MTVNVDRLRSVVEWVEREAAKEKDREWYQSAWAFDWRQWPELAEKYGLVCGTTYCVAGRLALEEGILALRDGEGELTTGEELLQFAARVLGITLEQAADLCGAYNNVYDVRRIAEEIAGVRL